MMPVFFQWGFTSLIQDKSVSEKSIELFNSSCILKFLMKNGKKDGFE